MALKESAIDKKKKLLLQKKKLLKPSAAENHKQKHKHQHKLKLKQKNKKHDTKRHDTKKKHSNQKAASHDASDTQQASNEEATKADVLMASASDNDDSESDEEEEEKEEGEASEDELKEQVKAVKKQQKQLLIQKRPAMHLPIGPNDIYVASSSKTPPSAYRHRALQLLQPARFNSKKKPAKSAQQEEDTMLPKRQVTFYALGAAIPLALQIIDDLLTTLLDSVEIVDLQTGSQVLIDDEKLTHTAKHRLNNSLQITLRSTPSS